MTDTSETNITDAEAAAQEPAIDPRDLARSVAIDVAEEPEQVGDVVDAIDLGDGVTDFRIAAHIRGYEGWQWSVTLYHDEELDHWTVNESSLIPTSDALMPPAWVPWKDRLEPTDLAPTDSIGTDPDDPRLEDGFRRTKRVEAGEGVGSDGADAAGEGDGTVAEKDDVDSAKADGSAEVPGKVDADGSVGSPSPSVSPSAANGGEGDGTDASDAEAAGDADAVSVDSEEDVDEAVEEFDLSRRHVLSPLGRAQTAKRWYEGPRGPKAMSTKTAAGNLCSTCGFFVPLKGELNLMFGVCANKWSPDDGRVVSLDHGCGEHSEIEPPEPSRLWVQSKPAFDDLHIDIIAQRPREDRAQIEILEAQDALADDDDIDETNEADERDGNASVGGVESGEAVDAVANGTDDDKADDTADDGTDDDDDGDDRVDGTDDGTDDDDELADATEQDIEENTEIDADSEDVTENTVPDEGPELETVVTLDGAADEDDAEDSEDDDESGDTDDADDSDDSDAADDGDAEPGPDDSADGNVDADDSDDTEDAADTDNPEESVDSEPTVSDDTDSSAEPVETDEPESGDSGDPDEADEADEAGADDVAESDAESEIPVEGDDSEPESE